MAGIRDAMLPRPRTLTSYHVDRRDGAESVRLVVFDHAHRHVGTVEAPSEDEAYAELLRRTAAMLDAVRAYGVRRRRAGAAESRDRQP